MGPSPHQMQQRHAVRTSRNPNDNPFRSVLVVMPRLRKDRVQAQNRCLTRLCPVHSCSPPMEQKAIVSPVAVPSARQDDRGRHETSSFLSRVGVSLIGCWQIIVNRAACFERMSAKNGKKVGGLTATGLNADLSSNTGMASGAMTRQSQALGAVGASWVCWFTRRNRLRTSPRSSL